MKTTIKVDNLKCGGCAAAITKRLGSLPGITEVFVLPEKDEVDIFHSEQADLENIKQELRKIGYPERGTAEGIDKFTSNVRSYASCAVGRLSKNENRD